jgi:CHAT domain-containing protein
MDRPKDARPHYERALAIREKALGPDHPDVATSLNNLAHLCRRTGRFAEARPLYERSLALIERTHGPDHLLIANGLNNLAVLLRCMGEGEAAVPLHARCLGIVESNLRRRVTALEPSDRHGAVTAVRMYLDTWLRLAPEVGRTGYEEVLRFKGLVARITAAECGLMRRREGVSDARIEGFRHAERKLAKLAGAMPSERSEAKRKAWREAYAAAAVERDRRSRELSRDLAPFRAGLERLDLDLGAVRGALGPDEALVDYLRSGGRYLAWIVRREGVVGPLELGDAEKIERAAAKPRATARKLVIEPVVTRLGKETRTLILCPDAALAAVAFAALPGAKEGRFLIDDYRIVFVSMAQDLVPRKDGTRAGRGALLLGGVEYGKPSRSRYFGPLPETRQEVEGVAALLPGEAPVLAGAKATEGAFRKLAPGRSVLHLATHGFTGDDTMRGLRRRRIEDGNWLGAEREQQLAAGHDPMLLAGLAMAGANSRDDGLGDDGILTAAEVSRLDLDGTDLVVLSACETALGKVESGEGVIGLVRGFQMAGAKRVIASLWQVDDAATRFLMTKFYEHRKAGDAEALRRAQVHVRANEKWRDPRYWAAWMLWGGD